METTPILKKCRRCFKEKPIESFVKRKNVSTGRSNFCKECKNKEYVEKRNNNWDYIRIGERIRERKLHNKDRRKRIIKHAKERSKISGLEFNLNMEDITIPDFCPVLNIPLDSSDRNHAPSLDRIDNSKGYIKSNVKIISNKANMIKRDSSIQTLLTICIYMINNMEITENDMEYIIKFKELIKKCEEKDK
jgi:hypothetical protein